MEANPLHSPHNDVRATRPGLVEDWRGLERWMAGFALSVAALDASGEWGVDGAASMKAWMCDQLRMSDAEAGRWLADGRFLARNASVAEAAVAGTLSKSQVSELRAAAGTGKVADLFAEHAEMMVGAVTGLTARETRTAAQDWRAKADAIIDTAPKPERDNAWSMSRSSDGSVVGRFAFDASTADQLAQAIGTAHSWDGPGDRRPRSVRDADAVASIMAFFNANHDRQGTPRHRPHVELGVEASDLADHVDHDHGPRASSSSGSLWSTHATDAALCDCVLHRVTRAGASILDYGRSTRSVPINLFRAVAKRDCGCRWPGCDRPVAWCDAHHIKWWRRYGGTRLENLLLLCAHHHKLVHRELWEIDLREDASVTFAHPDGRLFVSRPPLRHHEHPPGRAPAAA
jgi:hypothetical protein